MLRKKKLIGLKKGLAKGRFLASLTFYKRNQLQKIQFQAENILGKLVVTENVFKTKIGSNRANMVRRKKEISK